MASGRVASQELHWRVARRTEPRIYPKPPTPILVISRAPPENIYKKVLLSFARRLSIVTPLDSDFKYVKGWIDCGLVILGLFALTTSHNVSIVDPAGNS